MAARYEFVPLTAEHRALVLRWLAEPHIAEYWNDGEAPERRFARYLAEPKVERYICRIDGRDAGFIQGYRANDYPPPDGVRWNSETWGTDLYLGEPDLIGHGHGIGMLNAFVELLRRRGATRILIDPEPRNLRAIHVYERVGFRRIGVFTEAANPALFLEFDLPSRVLRNPGNRT
ncbi:MAG: GNAT family N-acetyltransferase [Candidatus Binataceae bacterium]